MSKRPTIETTRSKKDDTEPLNRQQRAYRKSLKAIWTLFAR